MADFSWFPTGFGDSGLRVAAAFRCVELLANSLALMPLRLRAEAPGGGPGLNPTDDGLRRLVRRPYPFGQFAFKQKCMIDASRTGNSYWPIQRDAAARPVKLRYWEPDGVEIFEGDDGEFYYGRIGSPAKDRIPAADMFHFRPFSIDGVYGLSRVAYCARTFAVADNLSERAEVVSDSAATPSAAFSSEVATPQQLEQALAMLARQWGKDRSGKPLVIPKGLGDPQKWPVNLTDLQFIESQRWSVEDICRVFGVPPHMLGVMVDRPTAGATTELTDGFLKYTLDSYCVAFEAEFTEKLAADHGHFVRLNRNALLRPTPSELVRQLDVQVRNGTLTVNESRAFMDLAPIDGGDVPRFVGQPLANGGTGNAV